MASVDQMDSAVAFQAGQQRIMGPLVPSAPQVFSWIRPVTVQVCFVLLCIFGNL